MDELRRRSPGRDVVARACRLGAARRRLTGVGQWPIRWHEFEWDDDKSDACLLGRGFDFAYAVRVFFDPNRIVVQDLRWDYGEDRYRVLGMVEERVYVVVYTVRGPGIRIISARKANAKEVGDDEHHAREE